jgi:hypothetical protein
VSESDPSPQSSAEVKNLWSRTFTHMSTWLAQRQRYLIFTCTVLAGQGQDKRKQNSPVNFRCKSVLEICSVVWKLKRMDGQSCRYCIFLLLHLIRSVQRVLRYVNKHVALDEAGPCCSCCAEPEETSPDALRNFWRLTCLLFIHYFHKWRNNAFLWTLT